MHLPRPSTRAAALLVAACWLLTGPAVVPIRAMIECEHQRHAHHQHHGTPAAPDGPCFCGEMGSALDVELPPATSAVLLPAPYVHDSPAVVPLPLPLALLPGSTPAPEPPPPIRVA